MSIAPNKRSVMVLYSRLNCPYSQRVRIVLAEKGVTVDVFNIDEMPKAREELQELNPYGTVPTLVDRDLVLYQSEIIMEYLDERFPHPPLMPVYPVARGRSRLMIYRINRDWYSLMDKILLAINLEKAKEQGTEIRESRSAEEMNDITQAAENARKELKEGLVSIAPVFSDMPFFLSEEYSLVDCCIAPLLWRLPLLGITLPPQGQPVLNYAKRLFEREAFLASLSDVEQSMRKS